MRKLLPRAIVSAAATLLLLAVSNVAEAFPNSSGSCTACHSAPGGSLTVTPNPIAIQLGNSGLLTFEVTSLGGSSDAIISVQGLESPGLDATIGTGGDNWTFINGAVGASYASDNLSFTGPYTLDLQIGAATTAGDYPIVVMLVGDGMRGLVTGFTLNVISELTGDYNGDGFVGVDDLNIILVNWNTSPSAGNLLLGDGSGDGFVGVDDLNIVLLNWNTGAPPGEAANIPEPASLGLIVVGSLALLRRTG